MKRALLVTFVGLFCWSSMAQKPDLHHGYEFKKIPKISLKNLRIPNNAGKNLFHNFEDGNEVDSKNITGNDAKKRGPANVIKNNLSVAGACTSQSGGIIASNDPRYDSCLDGSVYVKKVILTDPTQSILMNLNLDGLNFNPFD